MAGFYTDKQKRVRPIRGGRGGKGVVVASVAAVGVLAAGGGFGSLGAGSGVVGGQAAVQGSVGSVRLGGSSARLKARKDAAQKEAPRGAKGAWQRMGLREARRAAKQQASCVAASFGRVQDFLTKHRCTSLKRVLFTVTDDAGNTAVVSVAWVGLADRRTARQFRDLVDIQGSGDITPLGGALLDLGDIDFTGLRYGRVLNRATLTIAEAENAQGGQFDHESLDAIAEVAALLPRP
ncbi:hypothetical protein [Actinokineospora sp. NPDC004072]